VFVLGASRLVAYKKVESAIRVGELLDMPVVIAGTGPELARIQKLADDSTVPVFLLGRVSDPLLRELYLRACLYVFMAVEDFGIMPVEAMAAGTPVLVNHLGGAAESVGIVEGGATADPLSDASLLAGAETALSTAGSGNESKAAVFSNESFRRRFRNWVGQSVEGSQ
jgi:glycosyltransferase involved in cell wall biosynthesis